MKRFTITGTFEAESIDDAIWRLARYFALKHLGFDDEPLPPFPGPHEFVVEPEAESATGRAEAS